MTTKKQRAELESALAKWVFEGIAEEWSTSEILSAVATDWHKVVGTYTPASLRELTSWQGQVLDLVGLGLGWEIRADQKVKDAGLLMKAIEGAGQDSIIGALVVEVAEDILRGSSVSRTDLAVVGG